VRAPAPRQAAANGGHLSIQYTGHERWRLRGEQISEAVAP
jgi:hypothetical protein